MNPEQRLLFYAAIIIATTFLLLGLSIGRKLGTGEKLWHARKILSSQTRRDITAGEEIK